MHVLGPQSFAPFGAPIRPRIRDGRLRRPGGGS